MTSERGGNCLALALDGISTLDGVRDMVVATQQYVNVYKIGLELYTRFGPEVLEVVRSENSEIFLDLKLHDIPNTVAKAVSAATNHDVKYLTIHAAGGPDMLSAASKAANESSNPLQLLAVTLLTSIGGNTLRNHLGISMQPHRYVSHMADMAYEAGIGGIVCSASDLPVLDISRFREVVTPGIRRTEDTVSDQKRVSSPEDALRLGSTLLVVGRPITSAEDPEIAAKSFFESIYKFRSKQDDREKHC